MLNILWCSWLGIGKCTRHLVVFSQSTALDCRLASCGPNIAGSCKGLVKARLEDWKMKTPAEEAYSTSNSRKGRLSHVLREYVQDWSLIHMLIPLKRQTETKHDCRDATSLSFLCVISRNIHQMGYVLKVLYQSKVPHGPSLLQLVNGGIHALHAKKPKPKWVSGNDTPERAIRVRRSLRS